MHRHKSKHRIYTIVVGRKKPYVFMAVIAAFVIAFGCVYFISDVPDSVYNSFLKICLEHSFVTNSRAKSDKPALPRPGADTIMAQVSPVFFKTDNTLSVSLKEKDTQADISAHASNESKKVNEKNIASQNLNIKNETEYEVDTMSLVNEERSYSADGDLPKVLIIHTHACETYSENNGIGLGPDGSYRTTDSSINMVKIGENVNNIFKENGINVIHDKTLCDYPAYNSSYVKSLGVIEWYLEKYPSIEFVFDLHRDAIADADGTPTKLICNINGETTAQAMIVCGTDAMGLSNPYWKDNLILALKIQKNLEEMYPGFMRPVNLRKERFNMHKTKGSLLFEVGTHGNTFEEANLAAKYLAEGIVKTLKN